MLLRFRFETSFEDEILFVSIFVSRSGGLDRRKPSIQEREYTLRFQRPPTLKVALYPLHSMFVLKLGLSTSHTRQWLVVCPSKVVRSDIDHSRMKVRKVDHVGREILQRRRSNESHAVLYVSASG